MAVPKRGDLAKSRNNLKLKTCDKSPSEKSKYLALKYDHDNGFLIGYKLEEYKRLRDIYGSE